MKKKRLIFIIFVFLLPQVSALEQEELYSGTAYPGENVTIDNKTFVFNLGSITDMINIITPSGSMIVKQGECMIKDFYNVCFDGTEFWYHNYTIDKQYYKAKATVSEIIANVELTRTIENKDLLIDEETKVDVNFKNTGDRDAASVVYKDDFPVEFIVKDVAGNGCKLEGKGVRWRGILTPNLEKSCSYKIKVLNKTTFSSIASIQYDNGRKRVNETSDKVKITVPDYQLNISTYLPTNVMDIGEKSNFTIILRNINSEKDIQVSSFKINMPIGIKVPHPVKDLKQDYNRYRWSGTLTQEDKSMKFFFEIKAEKAGNYDLITNSAFLLNNVRKEVKTLDKLKVKKPGKEITEVEEVIIGEINLSESVDEKEENLSIKSSEEEAIVESEKTTITIETEPEEESKEEKKEEIMPVKKESIIKKLFGNVLFVIIDAIILSLIIITVMRIIKEKRQNY